MRRSALALLVASVAVAGCSRDKPSSYQGYVEGEYVYIATSIGGRLEHLLVQRGQTIAAGAPVFNLQADEEVAAKRQADEQLAAARAQLADLRLGRRAPEVDVARAQLAQAIAAEEQAARELKRDEAQLEAGGIARSIVEDARANHAIKAARVNELAGQLQVSRLPARENLIRAQDAQVAAAQAAASHADWRLGEKRVAATQAGLVVDTLYREGEWVSPGSPVVQLLPPKNLKVRFFVPEMIVSGLKPGRNVVLQCDGCDATVPAVVSYISNEAEYTPPVIYSNETRDKLVFMVEARPSSENAQRLRPGQPISVTLQ
jgi:HlyD family secretion protein